MLRKILTVSGPKALVHVYRRPATEDGERYVCKIPGTPGADYFTDDRDDAIGTAGAMAGFDQSESEALVDPRGRQVVAMDWAGKLRTLRHEDGRAAFFGERFDRGDGCMYVLSGGSAPHKSSSSGRVHVLVLDDQGGSMSYFPSVLNLHWD